MTEPIQSPEKPETIEVNDLDKFVGVLMAWHKSQVAELEHFLQIPEGTAIEQEGKEPIELSGVAHGAFLLGVTMSLAKLGSLPFVAHTEDDQSTG